MRRVPMRLRIAAGFAVAMALVLAGTGVYLYTQLGADLNRALDQDLRLRAQDLSAVVAVGVGPLEARSAARLVERGESFGQLLNSNGVVQGATRSIGRAPLIGPKEVRRALHGVIFLDRSSVSGLDESARLLATAVDYRGRRGVLVVGATRENRAEALRSLRAKLLIAGPIALALATTLGYVLGGLGLRAVDVLRQRAASISADRPGERLPVPAANDELKRLGLTLNDMLGRLEAALARERGFVADAGHELRTPLTLLRAELDFALHHADTEQELRDAVKQASIETDRLVQLAGDLLLIASLDRDGLPVRLESIGAQPLLESVRNRFAWRAEESGREMKIDVPPGLEVVGDRLRLEQALGNLVENALRHGRGLVQMGAEDVDGWTQLRVTDEGSGFSEAFARHAFDRFSRGDDARTGTGAGLGLAIVETIATAHGGTVGSANGPPTTLWLRLPQKGRTAPGTERPKADRQAH